MKKLFVLFIFLVFLSTYVSSECYVGGPLIGTLGDIKQEFRSSVEYRLNNVALIEERNDKITSIDYEDAVLKYASGNLEINNENNNNKIFISTSAVNFFNKGNIVVEGPPIQSCSLSFKGVFDGSGKLKTGLFRSYGKYKYGGTFIDVSPGNSLGCEGVNCNVEVKFDINGEKFTLLPGDNYISKGNSVNTITLIEAHDFGFEEKNAGSGTYAIFLIDFKDKIIEDYVPKNSLTQTKSTVKIEDRVKWEDDNKGVVIIESEEEIKSDEDIIQEIIPKEKNDENHSIFLLLIRWIQWFSFFFPEEK